LAGLALALALSPFLQAQTKKPSPPPPPPVDVPKDLAGFVDKKDYNALAPGERTALSAVLKDAPGWARGHAEYLREVHRIDAGDWGDLPKDRQGEAVVRWLLQRRQAHELLYDSRLILLDLEAIKERQPERYRAGLAASVEPVR